MTNKDLLILAILIILIGGGLMWQESNYSTNLASVLIRTDKTDYQKDGILKISIKNNLRKSICFSSCYPYYLEEKDGGWLGYSYSQCPESDLNEICLSASQAKFFEISLSAIKEGIYRLAVPVCSNCQKDTNFKEDDRFYSNEFSVR